MGRLNVCGRALLVCLALESSASAEVMRWTVDGQTREAIVYEPSDRKGRARAALVMAFHGYGDDMENFQAVDLHRAFPEAVVAYLQALPSANGLRRWQVERGQQGDRDLKLVDAALATLRGKFSIDESRVYATGFSNGGALTYLLWAERPHVFAAFAPVAGRMSSSVQPTTRRPLLHVAGTRDVTVRFSDQQAAFEHAVRVNGVTGATTPCGDGCTLYGRGTLAPVMVWIHEGAHTYPSGTSARIATFLRDQQLPRAGSSGKK